MTTARLAPIPRRLESKVAIVTGAGRGIGRAIAIRFAREGACVVLAQRSLGEIEKLASEIDDDGLKAHAIATDVRHHDSVRNLIHQTIETCGHIDVLCNNAGIGQVQDVVALELPDYEEVMNVNVRGALFAMKATLPHFLQRGEGAIINIVSVLSFAARPQAAAYCTSKGALLGLTRQVALEYAARGVRVNAIAPGFVDTEQFRTYCQRQSDPDAIVEEALRLTPMGRLGTPDDVAGAAAFLASEDARWVTGSVVVVDGGMLCQ
jgi:NAD(P)-dependent dehydrogenase (short-subunit alcohol dehydrogenase family)